jgi:FAD/FMN-containing dehydrogenase
MAQVLDTDVATFRNSFSGTVLTEGDADYDTARAIWNGAIDRRPAVIARCSTAEHVAAAIDFARSQDLEIAVRGGGHSFAGFSVNDGGLMIDLSAMRQVTVDPSARRAVCGGGATWADLDSASQAHGLAVTGGFVSHTGIGGLTLGGGIGWLTKKAGLSSDNLEAAEIVLADGRTVRASADENPELFWALRGGGGNFGVVTSFVYRLHQVGPIVQLGFFFWGLDKGAEALRFARDFVPTLPDGIGAFLAGLSAPPAPFVPEQHHFAPGYALLIAGFGAPEDHAQRCAEIRTAMPPLFELETPIPYAELQHMFDEGAPWGILGYEKALFLEELSDAAISVFTEHLPRRQSPLSFVPIFVLGGAYARVSEEATAFGGSRSARYAFNIAAVCPAPELLAPETAWVRDFWSAMRPHAMGSGSYVNFMSEDDPDRVRASYGAAKYERLARIKAEYDPDNVFHLNANIKPALQPA